MNEQEKDEILDDPNRGFYDRSTNKITLRKWSDLWEDLEYRTVKKTKINKHTISTCWLGMDHSLSAIGDPIIFETMIFHDVLLPMPYIERCSTEACALMQHDEAIKWLKGYIKIGNKDES